MNRKSLKNETKIEKDAMLAEAIVDVEEKSTKTKFPQKVRNTLINLIKKRNVYMGGMALVASTFLANVLNFIFNTYLANVLQSEDFALIGLMSGFFSFSFILFGTFATLVTYKGSFLIGRYGNGAGYNYWKYITKYMRYFALGLSALWFVMIPSMMQFFHTDNAYLFLFFGAVMLLGFFVNINQGFMASKMMFGSLAIVGMVDPLVKLLAAFGLVWLGLHAWTFSTIPLATTMIFLVGWILLKTHVKKTPSKAPRSEVEHFSKRFFFVTLLTSFSAVAYFTIDIFLAKHFLSAADTGRYLIISLVGKMVFFMGNLTAPFVIPLISRSEGAKGNSLKTLYILAGATAVLAFIGFCLFGLLAPYTVPLLYGAKAASVISYVPYFAFGMMCYTVSSVLVSYYLVRKIYTFTFATALLVFLQIGLIDTFHQNVGEIATVMSFILCMHLFITLALHFNVNRVKTFESLAIVWLKKQIKQSKVYSYAKAKGAKK